MKKIIVTVGPIPVRLDSVKIITNMFKGGLAIKTAKMLQAIDGFEIEVVKWKGTTFPFENSLPAGQQAVKAVTSVDDFENYRTYLQKTDADAYILAAAVANLMPVYSWAGKFPSHNYKVGEEFDIRFCIAPRIIDEIKQYHPRSTLIGYKLFDGSDEELVNAGWETLCGSRANVVFCNRPSTAAYNKIALMPDGTQIPMRFEDHITFMARVINLRWYSTEVSSGIGLIPDLQKNLECMRRVLEKIQIEKPPYKLGTIAVRVDDGFMTTTRGKRGNNFAKVHSVDHINGTILASQKVTMNAPFIDVLFKEIPCKWILHGHRQIEGSHTYPYRFSGTTEEPLLVNDCRRCRSRSLCIPSLPNGYASFNVEGHGYYAMFDTQEKMEKWVGENYPTS
jgi:hypothetical protein